MKSALLTAAWVLTGAGAQAADDIEPLDPEFLDYLVNMESDDDNWTLLDDREQQPSSDTESETPAPAAGKPTKEAAMDAVQER